MSFTSAMPEEAERGALDPPATVTIEGHHGYWELNAGSSARAAGALCYSAVSPALPFPYLFTYVFLLLFVCLNPVSCSPGWPWPSSVLPPPLDFCGRECEPPCLLLLLYGRMHMQRSEGNSVVKAPSPLCGFADGTPSVFLGHIPGPEAQVPPLPNANPEG